MTLTRIVARLLSLASGSLLVTSTHKRQMWGNKVTGYVMMKPQDFLVLTCTSNAEQRIIEDEAKSVEQYNAWAKSGDNILPPWIEVQIDPEAQEPLGKVLGHEGRHRAAACMKQNIKLMPVFIWAKKGHVSTYKIYPYPDDRERWHEWRYLSPEDIPATVIGQFQSVSKELPMKTWRSIVP